MAGMATDAMCPAIFPPTSWPRGPVEHVVLPSKSHLLLVCVCWQTLKPTLYYLWRLPLRLRINWEPWWRMHMYVGLHILNGLGVWKVLGKPSVVSPALSISVSLISALIMGLISLEPVLALKVIITLMHLNLCNFILESFNYVQQI